MADDKKVVVSNEDGDSAELNTDFAKTSDEIESANNDLNLVADIERLKAELAEKDKDILRLRADFENYKKRMAKELTNRTETAEQNFLTDLLPVVDNLQRALAHCETSDAETLRKAFQMIWTEIVKVLTKHGLEAIATENQKFDPNYHQAVSRIKDETKADGMIAAEFQRGYAAHGKVLRASMVQVVNNE